MAQGNGRRRIFRALNNKWAGLLIVLAVAAAYFAAYRAGYVWDDTEYVVNNPLLKNSEGLQKIWFEPKASPQYYPLIFTSFWAEYQLFGLKPQISHLINVALHAANALMIGLILSILGLRSGWIVAAVFALHPVHAESVAWITERKNVLSAFFYLLAMLNYLRFHPSLRSYRPESRTSGSRPWKSYALSLLFFICALLSKTIAASLPAALVIILWWKQDKWRWKDVVPLAPFFAFGIAAGLATAWMEVHHVGARGDEWVLSLAGRILVAGRAVWFYLGKLFWPHPLIFIYPRWNVDSGRMILFAFPAMVPALIVILWALRKKIGKGPIAGALFFIGTLFPALGFLNVYPFRYSFVADHFQYLASLGVMVVAVSAAQAWIKKAGKPYGTVLAAAGLVILTLLGVRTFIENRKFYDLETLWRDTLSKNTSCWMAHNNLGNILISQQKLEEATAHLETVLRLKPDFAVAHNNLSAVWFKRGNMEKAVFHGKEAVRINDRYAEAYINLGAAFTKQNNIPEAMTSYSRALEIDPDSVLGHNNMGNALARLGKFQEAGRHYSAALKIQPDLPIVHFHLGETLEQLGDKEGAIAHYRESIRLKSDFAPAHYRLGLLWLQKGLKEEAAACFQNAIRIQPEFRRLIKE